MPDPDLDPPGGRRSEETPQPPRTSEFGFVQPGGPAHRYPDTGGLGVVKLAVGEYDNNVYLVAAGGECVVVDAAAEPARILEEVRALGASPVAVVQTHGHFDHTGALADLVRELGLPVYGHVADHLPVRYRPVADGERIPVGGLEIEALHTPGHTPGSVTYRVGRFLFTGDTLFPAGPGNTWGDRSAFATIMRSVGRLLAFEDGTRICPGHGLDSTVGRERPYQEVWRARGW